MPDQPLTPARHTDVVRNLAYALRYDRAGGRVSDREPLTATLTAEHLAEALRLSGFVVMRTPPSEGAHADTPPPHAVVPAERESIAPSPGTSPNDTASSSL